MKNKNNALLFTYLTKLGEKKKKPLELVDTYHHPEEE
jgi:hypothetical protein